MSAPHIEDHLLEQYALGILDRALVPAVEEHLLLCQECQRRWAADEEFVSLFRAAATQPDARPRPFWRLPFGFRSLTWAGAAAAIATVSFLISVEFRRPPVNPATVYMETFRGPEAPKTIASGRPVRLVLDIAATLPARDYEVQIVDLVGKPVVSGTPEENGGHLSILTNKLKTGSYWLRVYRGANRELIAEYGLRAE